MGKRKSKIAKENIKKEMMKQYVIAYYKRNPDIFVERELEVKLHWWQKKLLRFIFKRGFKDEELLQDQESSICNQEQGR